MWKLQEESIHSHQDERKGTCFSHISTTEDGVPQHNKDKSSVAEGYKNMSHSWQLLCSPDKKCCTRVKGSNIQIRREGDRYCYFVHVVDKEQRISSPKHDALCSLMKYMPQGHYDFYSLLYAATLQRTLAGGKAGKLNIQLNQRLDNVVYQIRNNQFRSWT